MTREEQFRKNLAHAFELFDSILDDPGQLDQLPDGMKIAVMPADDPELCEANETVIRSTRSRSASPHGDPRARLSLSGSTLLVNV